MSPARRALARAVVLGLVALALAITQPVVLIGLPLAVILVACGPRNVRSAVVVVVVCAAALIGERTGLWWFERGWPLLLGGAFVWIAGWRRDWSLLEPGVGGDADRGGGRSGGIRDQSKRLVGRGCSDGGAGESGGRIDGVAAGRPIG